MLVQGPLAVAVTAQSSLTRIHCAARPAATWGRAACASICSVLTPFSGACLPAVHVDRAPSSLAHASRAAIRWRQWHPSQQPSAPDPRGCALRFGAFGGPFSASGPARVPPRLAGGRKTSPAIAAETRGFTKRKGHRLEHSAQLQRSKGFSCPFRWQDSARPWRPWPSCCRASCSSQRRAQRSVAPARWLLRGGLSPRVCGVLRENCRRRRTTRRRRHHQGQHHPAPAALAARPCPLPRLTGRPGPAPCTAMPRPTSTCLPCPTPGTTPFTGRSR